MKIILTIPDMPKKSYDIIEEWIREKIIDKHNGSSLKFAEKYERVEE